MHYIDAVSMHANNTIEVTCCSAVCCGLHILHGANKPACYPLYNHVIRHLLLLHVQVEANAMAVAGAEEYYRKMFTGKDDTWNIRDTHFLNTGQPSAELASAALAVHMVLVSALSTTRPKRRRHPCICPFLCLAPCSLLCTYPPAG